MTFWDWCDRHNVLVWILSLGALFGGGGFSFVLIYDLGMEWIRRRSR